MIVYATADFHVGRVAELAEVAILGMFEESLVNDSALGGRMELSVL